MTKSNGIDPHGQFARAASLKTKLATLDVDISNYKGDTAGLKDLKAHQADILMHLATLPST